MNAGPRPNLFLLKLEDISPKKHHSDYFCKLLDFWSIFILLYPSKGDQHDWAN